MQSSLGIETVTPVTILYKDVIAPGIVKSIKASEDTYPLKDLAGVG